jgi:hypothetical protein
MRELAGSIVVLAGMLYMAMCYDQNRLEGGPGFPELVGFAVVVAGGILLFTRTSEK